MKHAASRSSHHRRSSSISSIGSWISDLSGSVAPNMIPSSTHCHFASVPELRIVGRTSPEIQELCAQPNPLASIFQRCESSSTCSIQTIPTRSLTSFSNASSDAGREPIAEEPMPSYSIDELATSLTSLQLRAFNSSPPHVDHYHQRRLKAPTTKRFSPTKTYRRNTFDTLPLPQDFVGANGHSHHNGRSRRCHRRNTTQIIMQGR